MRHVPAHDGLNCPYCGELLPSNRALRVHVGSMHRDKMDGLLEKVNLIGATTNNYAPICMSIRDAAKGLIKGDEVDEGLLNMVEMGFRAYDPCFACATHSLQGQAPLKVEVYDHERRLRRRIERNLT